MNAQSDTTAIVLAGGLGSRMNYQDKAWLGHEGKPLIQHVLDRIAPQVAHVLISRNGTDPRYEDLPWPCIADNTSMGFEGPLAGVSACASRVETGYALVIPCDTPYLPTDLAERLSQNANQTGLAVAHDALQLQPLVFLCRTPLLAEVDGYLGSGKRSVTGWIESVDHEVVDFENSLYKGAFENINEPGQLV